MEPAALHIQPESCQRHFDEKKPQQILQPLSIVWPFTLWTRLICSCICQCWKPFSSAFILFSSSRCRHSWLVRFSSVSHAAWCAQVSNTDVFEPVSVLRFGISLKKNTTDTFDWSKLERCNRWLIEWCCSKLFVCNDSPLIHENAIKNWVKWFLGLN